VESLKDWLVSRDGGIVPIAIISVEKKWGEREIKRGKPGGQEIGWWRQDRQCER